jgi:hypothetical protein
MVPTAHPVEDPTVTTTTTAWPPAPRAGSPVRSLFRATAAIVYVVGGLSAANLLTLALGWMVSSGPLGLALAALLSGGGLGAAVRFGVPRPLLKGVCIAGFVLPVAGVAILIVWARLACASGCFNFMS